MAGLVLSNTDIDIHFEYYFRNLDVSSKRRVINKFVESLTIPAPNPEPSMTLDELIDKWGPWDDTDYEGKPMGDLREARVGYIRRDDENN